MADFKIEYKKIIINNQNAASFRLLHGARGVYNPDLNKITVYRYEIAKDLDLPANEVAEITKKIAELSRKEQEILAHEKHHAYNNIMAGSAIEKAKNIYEYIGLRSMGEASAYMANNLFMRPLTKENILHAAVLGTEEFLSKKELYINKYKSYLYENVVFFNVNVQENKMLENSGLNIFKESYSPEFHAALSVYFTYDGYSLMKDKQFRELPEWSNFVDNVHKIRAACAAHATTMASEILNCGMFRGHDCR